MVNICLELLAAGYSVQLRPVAAIYPLVRKEEFSLSSRLVLPTPVKFGASSAA